MTGFVEIARTSEVPDGWVLDVRVGPRTFAVANRAGTFHVLDGTCSHAGGPLGSGRLEDGCLLRCPWHEAAFDVRTGEPGDGPARRPVRTYPTHVSGGVIYAAIERPGGGT